MHFLKLCVTTCSHKLYVKGKAKFYECNICAHEGGNLP